MSHHSVLEVLLRGVELRSDVVSLVDEEEDLGLERDDVRLLGRSVSLGEVKLRRRPVGAFARN